jgi:hypothetical protein
MSMQRLRYEFVLEAATPIAHHAETIGNESVIMRRKIRQPGGWAHVPVITGDTKRHGLREAAAYAFLDAAGLLEQPSLSEAALRLLFAGGMVTGKGDAGTIKLDQYRELCELVPSMGLFGGCANNRVIPGRLVVEDATLLCTEAEAYLPAWASNYARECVGLDACRAHVEEEQRVRMDPTLVPQKRLLLATDEQVSVNKRLEASEKAHDDKDALRREEAKSTMMPRRFERVAQGSLFFWACEATCYSPLDEDTFHVTIAAYMANARVGGKRGTGHGLLRPVAAQGVHLARPAENLYPIDAMALRPDVGKLFQSHVAARKTRIAEFLRSVNA